MPMITSASLGERSRRSWKGLRSLVVGLAVAASLPACGGSTGPEEFSDPSVPIRVAAGHEFALRLESNASTGYSWRLAQPLDAAVLSLVRSRYDQGQTSLIGAPGAETWTFRAAARGQTSIDLDYVRPFAPDEPPARSASFSVTVE